MTSRPTNRYPSPPKLEHFLQRPTNIKAVGSSPAAPGAPSSGISSEYQQLTESRYQEYLDSHSLWLAQVEQLDSAFHDQALKKRLLEQYREVVSLDDERTVARSRQIVPFHRTPDMRKPAVRVPVIANVVMQKKVPHAPEVSTQPHQAEKRANRKKVRDAQVKVQANVAEAKAELLLEKTVPVIKAQRKAVEKVTACSRLHKAEETAAKSAVVRAAAIKKSSPDLVPEVKPDDGWKLVTRKKGAVIPTQVLQLRGKGTNSEEVLVHVDPGVRQPLALSAIRAPTATGKA